MATYAIGDIQGCYRSLKSLLKQCQFNPNTDTLWAVGDLVNRGALSLEVLCYLHDLGDAVQLILGNHDLYLLAVYYNAWPLQPAATLLPILHSSQADTLIDWLRRVCCKTADLISKNSLFLEVLT